MKIGIITYHRVRNYGSVLQSYALMKYLEKMGHDVYIINYIPKPHSTYMEFLGSPEGSLLRKTVYILGSFPLRLKVYKVYKNFRKRYLKLSKKEYTRATDFAKYPLDMDVYITGSDQVWNSRYNFQKVTNEYPYYLDFTPDKAKRISYASSFGEESLDLTFDAYISSLIGRYSYLSVREKSGLKKLSSLGRNDGLHVLDPTLLLEQKDWMPIFGQVNIKEKYLLIYEPQREKANKFKEYAVKIAKEKNLKIVKINKEYRKEPWIDTALYPSVNDFLSLFFNADFVLTNSFHGIAFLR